MPRTCLVCIHEKRAEIEAAIAAGTSNRSISLQYGMSHMAVQRHASEHIAQAIKQSQAAKDEAQALDVVKQLKAINTVTLTILQEARAEKRNGMALFAIDRVMKQLELQAKLLGDINDGPQVNIMITPEWHAIRGTIIAALVPYPDARVAVASALAHMEQSRARLN